MDVSPMDETRVQSISFIVWIIADGLTLGEVPPTPSPIPGGVLSPGGGGTALFFLHHEFFAAGEKKV